MRRRDAIANHRWLRRLDTDLADGRIAAVEERPAVPASSLLRTINQWGYMVEMWIDGEAVRCRCYPLPRAMQLGPAALALSYSGSSIHAVLLAAWSDLCRLSEGYVSYDHSIREVVRWAP